jgi:hypothetical protein
VKCPICLKSVVVDGGDTLDRHLQQGHNFDALHAGRIARRTIEWREYDAEQTQSV